MGKAFHRFGFMPTLCLTRRTAIRKYAIPQKYFTSGREMDILFPSGVKPFEIINAQFGAGNH
jgi:hypothetical protein